MKKVIIPILTFISLSVAGQRQGYYEKLGVFDTIPVKIMFSYDSLAYSPMWYCKGFAVREKKQYHNPPDIFGNTPEPFMDFTGVYFFYDKRKMNAITVWDKKEL